ncbi:MAG TPA: beta-ketoacyl-[acyl-carrier-protein] synthase family protein [Candidatus Limnocylindrales bacterium]|nr:beta-ketoacyl-[acyl-carrier-protein] synthase family protein [Candidatus Limnocylindrales bacterium]
MPHRRIAVTGLGVICSLGHNVPDAWEALRAGRPAITPFDGPELAKLRFQNAARVCNFDPAAHFPLTMVDHLDRFAQFALIAAREAAQDAGISWTPELRQRAAVITGSSIGGQSTQDVQFWDVYHLGRERVHPLTIPRTMPNAGASQISMEFGITGPVFTLSTACSSSNHAIGVALQLLRGGGADIAIAGGSEAPLSFGMLKAWEAMRVVSPDVCRPFCRDRKGIILGEGAGMLILEPLDAARARGAHIYAELAGAGMSSDAAHITQPTVDGPVRAIRGAIADAGLRLEQVGYINAHGTGTPGNDPAETRAIREVFGPLADRIPVSSTKSMHGHALGAAGAIEAVATLLAMRDGVLPPTANFTEPDPACDLDYIPNVARTARIEAALSNSFAFGGLNAVLAFRSVNS